MEVLSPYHLGENSAAWTRRLNDFDGGMAESVMRIAVFSILIAIMPAGCSSGPEYIYAPDCPTGQPGLPPPPVVSYSNPIFIPVADPHQAWEMVVDVVDDYFRIEHEAPVRQVGNMTIEGTITTAAEISPTIFEPWRHDTVDPDERLENTLQTMRRRAVIRVFRLNPEQGGYWVDVAVYKDLEDLARPEHATAGAATFRYDDTLNGIENPPVSDATLKGWIPKGATPRWSSTSSPTC